MASSNKDKKQMDVARPIDIKPDIGSKPMIVGHKSMAGDPMMREPQDESIKDTGKSSDALEEPAGAISAVKKKITPVDGNEKPAEVKAEEEKSEESVVEEKLEVEEKAPAEEVKETEPAPTETTEEKVAAAEEPKQDATTEEKTEETTDTEDKDKKKIDPVAEEMERDDKLRKIIESKKYHVSIKQQAGGESSGGKKSIFLLIFLLIVGLGALFYLVDTKKLDPGFDLPFSIFGEEEAVLSTPVVAQQEVQEPAAENETASDVAEWKTFENEELGISFEYPDDWSPTIEPVFEDYITTGKAYTINLTPVKFGGTIYSDDWSPSEKETGIQTKEFDSCKVDETSKVKIEYLVSENACIVASDNTFVIEKGNPVYGEDMVGESETVSALYYQRVLNLNGNLYVIKISTAPMAEGSEEKMKAAYDEKAKDLIQLNESIKSLEQ